MEQLQGIHASFAQHVEVLETINPKLWDGLDMNKELNKALSAVDDSRAEYTKSLPKISPESDTDAGDAAAASAGYQLDYGSHEGSKDFMYWLKAGLAFTLPLCALGLVLLCILYSLIPAAK